MVKTNPQNHQIELQVLVDDFIDQNLEIIANGPQIWASKMSRKAPVQNFFYSNLSQNSLILEENLN